MSRTRTITLTLGSLAAGAVLATGVTGLALADDSAGSAGSAGSSSSSTSPSTGTSDAPGMRDGMRDGRGHGGPGRGMMGALRDAVGEPIHGETVVKKDDGSFATVRHLRGTVTAVSADSITVKAEDGYSATFAIDADTVVRTGLPERGTDPSASTSTVADVKVGDVAHVSGVVDGSTATADRVFSMTAAQAAELEALREAHEQQHAAGAADADDAAGSTSSSSTQIG
jgi:hypothetical protein